MRFKTVLTLVASETTISNAFYSPYYTDWEATVPDCLNGPVQCGTDGECGRGEACRDGLFCVSTSRYACRLNCQSVGRVNHPFAFCKCISIAERDAMFCNQTGDDPISSTLEALAEE